MKALSTQRGGYVRAKTYPDPPKPMLTAVEVPKGISLSILDEDNPHSLINLVPKDFATRMKGIDKSYFEMSQVDLEKKVRPDDIMNRLKLRFWDEWQVALLSGVETKVEISSVYYGVCTEEYFYAKVLSKPKVLAWVITPPIDYVVTMRDVLRQGIERLSDIIRLPLVQKTPMKERGEYVRDEDGEIMYVEKVDKAVLSEVSKIVKMLSERVHGAIVQRIDVSQKNLSLDLTPATKRLLENPEDKSPELSNDDLQRLDAQLQHITSIIDVSPEEDDEPTTDNPEG